MATPHETRHSHPGRLDTIEHRLTKSSNTFRLTFHFLQRKAPFRTILGEFVGHCQVAAETPLQPESEWAGVGRCCSVSGLPITTDWRLLLVPRHGSLREPFRRQTECAAFTGPLTAKGLGDSALRLATHASLAPFSSADPRYPIPAHKSTSHLHYRLLTTRACRLCAACTPDNNQIISLQSVPLHLHHSSLTFTGLGQL